MCVRHSKTTSSPATVVGSVHRFPCAFGGNHVHGASDIVIEREDILEDLERPEHLRKNPPLAQRRAEVTQNQNTTKLTSSTIKRYPENRRAANHQAVWTNIPRTASSNNAANASAELSHMAI
jgi:hypothetical protein